ncbi:MAG: GntR family transcriptional regulator [Thermomicrobiales bacterium]
MTEWHLHLPGKTSPVPLYYQLAEAIEQQIASGALRPGDRLPSERDLAQFAGISRMTARQALTYLAERGAIDIRHGIGTFVAHPKLTSDPLHLLGFTEEMMATGGGTVSSRVLAQDRIPAPPPVATALHIEPGETVIRIQRLRSLNGTPMLLETSFFPLSLCAGIETVDLSDRSLYATLDLSYDVRLTHAQQSVEAIAANTLESSLFGIDKGAPMLLLEGVASTASGQPGEYFKAVYRGDRFKFALRSLEPASTEQALPIDLVMT